jgi:hypothetical protein
MPAPVQALVDQVIRAALDGLDEVTGLSCLADGPDQIFARAVLDHSGQIEAVVPATRYRDGLPASAHAEYDRLLARAVTVHRLPFTDSTSEAHMAASELMINQAGQLWAVWDGQPARGYGGTADVVAAARAKGLPVRVIWPRGAHRD